MSRPPGGHVIKSDFRPFIILCYKQNIIPYLGKFYPDNRHIAVITDISPFLHMVVIMVKKAQRKFLHNYRQMAMF